MGRGGFSPLFLPLTLCGNACNTKTDMQKSRNEIDWDLARVFLAVAREGQLLGAARALGLDHATVTRRINALEATLGVKLIARSTTGSRLTSKGVAFLETAAKVEATFLSARASLTEGAGLIDGTVRVGAPDGFGTLFLAPRMGTLLARHPLLTLQLAALPRSFSLSRREADIAITVERPVEGRLKVRKLTDYTLSLYASPGYLKASPPLASKRDLANHRLVDYVSDLLFADALDFSAELGEAAAPRFQCASVLGQMAAIESGAGVGLLHDYAVPKGLKRVVPEVRLKRAYWLVTHADVAHAPAVRAVSDFIVRATAEAAGSFQS